MYKMLCVAWREFAATVLTRGFLLQHVWAYEPDVHTRTVDWHVAVLRKRLGPAGMALRTVRGAGYCWNESA